MNVELKKITKNFGSVKVVKDFDLGVYENEFVSLVGPSGCGKTTLLRMIAGLERPTSGEIFFNDKAVKDVTPANRDIAMVFQSYALYPHMNVYKNLSYSLKVRKTPKKKLRERVLEVANILEIDQLLERKPKALSGGQRQRVALGRAMVRNPSIFLMDEPLSNLDAKLRVTMRAELKRFHINLKTTTIYVTHDQLEAMTMSDKIAIINKGRLQQFGTPDEVYNQPANLFVAGFIGSPPMNLLKGRIMDEGGSFSFAIDSGKHTVPKFYNETLIKGWSGKDIIMGIRPQGLTLVRETTGQCSEAQVYTVENLGSEKLVDLIFGKKTRLKAQVDSDETVRVDDRVWFKVNENKMYLFDPESGNALERAQ